jgi:hypothetical protein
MRTASKRWQRLGELFMTAKISFVVTFEISQKFHFKKKTLNITFEVSSKAKTKYDDFYLEL